jgi:hypothetical protein
LIRYKLFNGIADRIHSISFNVKRYKLINIKNSSRGTLFLNRKEGAEMRKIKGRIFTILFLVAAAGIGVKIIFVTTSYFIKDSYK